MTDLTLSQVLCTLADFPHSRASLRLLADPEMAHVVETALLECPLTCRKLLGDQAGELLERLPALVEEARRWKRRRAARRRAREEAASSAPNTEVSQPQALEG